VFFVVGGVWIVGETEEEGGGGNGGLKMEQVGKTYTRGEQ
jgi:hypothetical protein